ncbi:MAG: hypothetical protein Kow00121_24710 [Elainellaceae cyanobacterium]
MSSPFQTIEEFNQATEGPTGGAIYTFANNPALIGIAIIASVLLFCWFIYASFTVKAEQEKVSNPVNLSVLIVAGLVSLASSLFPGHTDSAKEASARRETRATASAPHHQTPFALLGLAGLGAASSQQTRRLRRRKTRQARRTPRV